MRWRLRLEEYEYEIDYKKGKENVVADALSRLHPVQIIEDVPTKIKIKIIKPYGDIEKELPDIPDEEETVSPDEQLLRDYERWKTSPTAAPIKLTANRPHWTQLTYSLLGQYNEKTWINRLHDLMALQHDRPKIAFGIGDYMKPLHITSAQLMIRFLLKDYPGKPLLFAQYPNREYTAQEIKQILIENHDNSQHQGENKTIERIKSKHYWKNLETDVTNYIKHCDICQRNKLTRIRPKEEAVITDTPSEPNDKIALDIIGPLNLTKQGNQFILSIQDCLTKYLLLVPLADQKAESIINSLINHYIYIFSSPKHILTDQGQNFVCKLMETFEKAFKIKLIKTTSFHPQSNGSLERTHGTIKDLLRTNIDENKNEWDEHLNYITMAYNTSVHTGTGYTPFELTFGREANMPSAISLTPKLTQNELFKLWKNRHQEYLQNAKRIIQKNKERYKRDQDRKIRLKGIYNIGDLVLLHNDHKEHKLDKEWLGPYKILEVKTPNYLIQISDKKTLYTHGNRIKPYHLSRE